MKQLIRNLAPEFVINWYHLAVTFASALMYGFPAKNLVVIGITGTNGKSTTVDMTTRILKEAGIAVASLSSVRFQIKDKEWRNTKKMTMPGRFFIQQFLRKAKDAGCTHIVLEVTSEGMLQHRHRFIPFHAAVFTNLSPEHIERHGSFENYRETKGKLFATAKAAHIINVDDEHAGHFLSFPAKEIHTYGMAPKKGLGSTHVQAENIQENKGLEFKVQDTLFNLNLLGRFNILNALAAIATAQSQGVSLEICKRALEKMKGVPGRMEEVISSPFRVIVDYAFTPAALEKVYKTLKPASGRLLCVLGSTGGGRDAWKRPVLGKIASENCDTVFVTDEDPYEEDPEKIMDQVLEGTQGNAEKIVNRRDAIVKALGLAKPRDVVVITGKGSEDSMQIAGGKKIPWDDREIVREEMQSLEKK